MLRLASRCVRFIALVFACVSASMSVGTAAAGVLTNPSQFSVPTTKIDFETFPDGTIVPYVTQDIDDEWASLGVLIGDDTPADGVNAYSSTYSIPPHSGIKAIGDSMNAAGGWVEFRFTGVVQEAGVWVQNGDVGSKVEFYDASGGLLAQVPTTYGDVFVGYSSGVDIKSLRVVDGDYYMVDDLEFGGATCTAIPQAHGAGCAGSGGFTPSFTVDGCTLAGAPITLELSQGLGGAPAYVGVGVAPASIPAGGSCTLNVFPIVFLLGPVPLSGAGPGAGAFLLNANIPPTAPPGASFGLQMFVVDPGSSTGFTATNGIIVTVG